MPSARYASVSSRRWIRRFGHETQRNYIRDVGRFATFLGRSPDTATAEDVRRFQIDQGELDVPAPTMNAIVSALRFFFTQTLDRPDLARKLVRMRHERKLPVVLSRDEVARLLDATTCLKHQAALSVAYLLQSYHYVRLPTFDPTANPDLFSVLGSVQDFKTAGAQLNAADFRQWLIDNEASLKTRVSGWIPHEVAGEVRQALLDGMVVNCVTAVDTATRSVASSARAASPPEAQALRGGKKPSHAKS